MKINKKYELLVRETVTRVKHERKQWEKEEKREKTLNLLSRRETQKRISQLLNRLSSLAHKLVTGSPTLFSLVKEQAEGKLVGRRHCKVMRLGERANFWRKEGGADFVHLCLVYDERKDSLRVDILLFDPRTGWNMIVPRRYQQVDGYFHKKIEGLAHLQKMAENIVNNLDHLDLL